MQQGCFMYSAGFQLHSLNSVLWPHAIKIMGSMLLMSLCVGQSGGRFDYICLGNLHPVLQLFTDGGASEKPALTCRCNNIPAHF